MLNYAMGYNNISKTYDVMYKGQILHFDNKKSYVEFCHDNRLY